MEPRPPALGAQSLSHWTTREVPRSVLMRVRIVVNSKTLELFKKKLNDHLSGMLWKILIQEELELDDLQGSN